MAIRRRPARPRRLVALPSRQTRYSVTLTVALSRAWRAAFFRPPPALSRGRFTPEFGRVHLDGARVLCRTTPVRRDAWAHRIDRWVVYTNSLVEA